MSEYTFENAIEYMTERCTSFDECVEMIQTILNNIESTNKFKNHKKFIGSDKPWKYLKKTKNNFEKYCDYYEKVKSEVMDNLLDTSLSDIIDNNYLEIEFKETDHEIETGEEDDDEFYNNYKDSNYKTWLNPFTKHKILNNEMDEYWAKIGKVYDKETGFYEFERIHKKSFKDSLQYKISIENCNHTFYSKIPILKEYYVRTKTTQRLFFNPTTKEKKNIRDMWFKAYNDYEAFQQFVNLFGPCFDVTWENLNEYAEKHKYNKNSNLDNIIYDYFSCDNHDFCICEDNSEES